MHYDKYAFSNTGGMTIVTKDPFYENLIGQRMTASPQDIELLDVMYDPSSYDLSTCRCRAMQISGFDAQGYWINGIYYLDGTVQDKLLYGPNHNGYYLAYNKYNWSWAIQDANTIGQNYFYAMVYDVSLCPEDIDQPWSEWNGSMWAYPPDAKAECVEWISAEEQVPDSIKMPKNEKLEKVEEANGLCPSDEDKWIWEIDNWSSILATYVPGQVLRKQFQDREGYTFEASIYPNGGSSLYRDNISVFFGVVQGQHDDELPWPLYGRYLTMGLVEPTKTCRDRMTHKMQFTSAQYGNDYYKPADVGSTTYGWNTFLSHEEFNAYDFVDLENDKVKFVFSAEDATGQFLDCDVEELGDFERCFYHPVENDLTFDKNGVISGRGVVSTKSPPITIYGKRCLHLDIETEGLVTISVQGENAWTGEEYQYYLQQHNPTVEGHRMHFDIDLGHSGDFSVGYQQYIKLEIVNHENVETRFIHADLEHDDCEHAA